MAYSVSFKRGDQVLEWYEFEVENPKISEPSSMKPTSSSAKQIPEPQSLTV